MHKKLFTFILIMAVLLLASTSSGASEDILPQTEDEVLLEELTLDEQETDVNLETVTPVAEEEPALEPEQLDEMAAPELGLEIPENAAMLAAGQPTGLTPSYSFTPAVGGSYTVNARAENLASLAGQSFTLQYSTTALQLVDLCSLTYAKELSSGQISDTGITVTGVSAGSISFTVNKQVPSGSTWSGVLNNFKFKGLRAQATTITLSSNIANPVATSIAFVNTPYSATIPASGNTTTTVQAVVKDQFGNVMSSLKPTYSINPAYGGVTTSGTTGTVTIQSTAAAGTATVRASYTGLTTVSTSLTLTRAGADIYSVEFDEEYYLIGTSRNDYVTVSATAKKNGVPVAASIIYTCNRVVTAQGDFYFWDMEDSDQPVTATASFGNGITAEATTWIYLDYSASATAGMTLETLDRLQIDKTNPWYNSWQELHVEKRRERQAQEQQAAEEALEQAELEQAAEETPEPIAEPD